MTENESGKHKEKATQRPGGPPWRVLMHDVIFESDTRAGWVFDVALLVAILCSIVVVSLETIPSDSSRDFPVLDAMEWILTILFTVEYVARLACARHPLRYAISFWGVIDLLSILPTYVGVFIEGSEAESFVILRSIRLLRVFRVLKLWRMMDDAEELSQAIWKSRHKIVVFLMVVLVAVTISGTLMYFVENTLPKMMANGELTIEQKAVIDKNFGSIPQAMYWAIVTMTTVGYGDIVPQTTIGKVISAALILLGYSLIIVPSGFVTAELTSKKGKGLPEAPIEEGIECPRCASTEHHDEALYCYRCGERIL